MILMSLIGARWHARQDYFFLNRTVTFRFQIKSAQTIEIWIKPRSFTGPHTTQASHQYFLQMVTRSDVAGSSYGHWPQAKTLVMYTGSQHQLWNGMAQNYKDRISSLQW